MSNLTWWREVGQKIKGIIRSRNTHTQCVFVSIHGQTYTGGLVCISFGYPPLCPARLALCGSFTCARGVCLSNLEENSKDPGGAVVDSVRSVGGCRELREMVVGAIYLGILKSEDFTDYGVRAHTHKYTKTNLAHSLINH